MDLKLKIIVFFGFIYISDGQHNAEIRLDSVPLTIPPGTWIKPEEVSSVPEVMIGRWYSQEDGINHHDDIYSHGSVKMGTTYFHQKINFDTYVFIITHKHYFHCSKFVIRTGNIMERFDTQSTFMSSNLDYIAFTKRNFEKIQNTKSKPNSTMSFIESFCTKKGWSPKGHLMIRVNPTPVNCRTFIHGHYQFSYLNKYNSSSTCDRSDAALISCPLPGSQFSQVNQQFTINFRSCDNAINHRQYNNEAKYSCLGDWWKGGNQYMAVENLKESRDEERYRIFVKNREDRYLLGMSLTPSPDQLTTPQNSPLRLRLNPIRKSEDPMCFLPRNMTGLWVSSGKGEPVVEINSTHILETIYRGHVDRINSYVCHENRGNRYVFVKVAEEGCQNEYVCWEIIPRHHNLIRYRKSRSIMASGFQVCDYINFRNFKKSGQWKYDTLILKEPDPLPCPIGGRFTFGQKGTHPLEPKILGGVTENPLDSYKCFHKVTDMSICDEERKFIIIDTNLCITLNQYGTPIDTNSVADYRLQCVGFWKENLISYMITYDPTDSVSSYRCWVYMRVGHGELRLSQALGSACGLHQTYLSSSIHDGAAVALNLSLHDKFNDGCPMYFDDGGSPWTKKEDDFIVFNFFNSGSNFQKSSECIFLVYVINMLLK